MPRRNRKFLKLIRKGDEWDWDVEHAESDEDHHSVAR